MNSLRVKQIVKEELSKVLKEVDWYEAEKEFNRDDTKGDYPRGGEDEEEFDDEPFIPDPTESLEEYPTGGPGRPHKKYTGSPKPELRGKKYAEKVEIWKKADPEWGRWYDKNMDIISQQDAGGKARVDDDFKAWTKSWNAKSGFSGKKK